MVAALLGIWLARIDAAPTVVLKMATLAPQNSVWYNALMQMGSTWKKATDGQVSMTLFAGQTQGSDEDVLRKMRINQLQGAALSAIGLWHIDEATNVFTIPLFYESDEELFHVMAALTPMLQKRFEERGFVLLSWGHAGWAQVFSRGPIKTLDDLKRAKLYTSAGDERMVQWYRKQGFNPVARATTDVMTSLQTGQLDALPVPPLAALFMRYDTLTPYMLDVAIAPLLGGQVLTRRAWAQVPDAVKPAVLEAARAAEQQMQRQIPVDEQKAIGEMEKRGLKVIRLKGTKEEAAFTTVARAYADSMRGEWVPPDVFDEAVRVRDAFRARKGPNR
jgi:TRAP-type C4-dicarboxylate transport system substrate-binding protein